MLKEIELPKYLYKYCKLDQHFNDIVKNKELYFQSPPDFNDPYDCNVSWKINYSKADIEQFVRNTVSLSNSEAIIQQTIKKFQSDPTLIQSEIDALKKLVHRLGVSCFSKDGENPLMWSHYADKHKGICITFNAMELVNGFHQSVYPVEYVTNFPKVDFMKNHNNSVNQIIKSKSVNWKHEQEFRIVIDKKGTAPLPQRSI